MITADLHEARPALRVVRPAHTPRPRRYARKRVLARVLAAALVGAFLLGYLSLAAWTLNGRVQHYIAVSGQPFVLSDLFMPWYGAQALVAGTNPYSDAFTDALHGILYGGRIQSGSGIFVQSFAYPAYTVVSLAPALWLPFEVVRWLAVAVLVGGIVISAWLWTAMLGVAQTKMGRCAESVFALTFYPSLDLLWLQQLTGLVFLYLVLAHVAAARRRYIWAGILLALAMIKPQVAAVPAAGLLFWSVCRRERWAVSVAFVATMVAQFALAEYLLPGWLIGFGEALTRHRELNSLPWLLSDIAGGEAAAVTLIVGPLLALLAWCWWRQRGESAASPGFLCTVALTFAIGVAVIPYDIGSYNKTLLLVPVLTLWAAGDGNGAIRRVTRSFALLLVAAPMVMMGAMGWVRWLQLGLLLETVPVSAIDLATLSAIAVYVSLPLLLLPAIVTLWLERARRPALPRVASRESRALASTGIV